MKAFRAIWFSLLLPLAACGSDRVSATPKDQPAVAHAQDVVVDAPAIVAPVVEAPKSAPVTEVVAMPEKFGERMTLGKALVAKGEHPRARELFLAAAELEPKHAEPHIELARSYIATNDRALAMKSANKAVKLAPKSSGAYNTLGRAELLRHGYANAIAAFTTATELDQNNAWAWNNLGYTHLLLKEYEQAVFALVEATAKPNATGYMWNNLGLAYEQLDELDNARFAFQKGGKLGSKEALASGKRLEGVETIIVDQKPAPLDVADEAQAETSYHGSEDMPEDVADDTSAEIEEQIELDTAESKQIAEDAAKAASKVKVEVKVEEVIVDDKPLADHVKDDAAKGVEAPPVQPPKSI